MDAFMTSCKIVLIFVCFKQSLSQDRCDPISGPIGKSCVYIPTYMGFQLANCTMSDDIMTATDNSFKCAYSCRNYCWLPCMVEKNGLASGTISDDCKCAINNSWCYENTGSEAFF